MATIAEALTLAVQHHQAGRLQPAEQIYRQILQIEPNHPEALHLLGVIASKVGKAEIAVEYIGRALQLRPDNAEAHSNLGVALKDQGKLEEATACFGRALQLKPDFAEAHYNLGVALKDQGKLEEAAASYLRALQLKPDNAEALNNLGIALREQGKLEEAVTCYRVAVQLKPDKAEAHSNLGVALKEQGKLEEAVTCYHRALQLKPGYAEAHNNLGNALRDRGKLEEAVACFGRALHLKPDYAEAHSNLGMALKDQGKVDEAVACFGRALHLKPACAQAHYSLGSALKEQGRLEGAVACYRRALALKPDYAEAHSNLGLAFSEQGRLDEAVACYRRALALKPDFAEAISNLGMALRDQGKLDEAVACYRRALALKPDFAEALSNLGVALSDQGKLDGAVACYRQALALKPDFADAHWNQSLFALLAGDFERGWAEYEWRWKIKGQHVQRRGFSQPRWDGQPLAGRTILLHAEQGLGDTIQFVRYVPLVKKDGGIVIFECQPTLIPLLSGNLDVDRLISVGAPLPSFDVQAPLLSLPGILGTTLATIPAKTPYLRAEPGLVEYWRKELEPLGGFKIGIAWQGNPTHASDSYRSFPLTQFATLARADGVRLVSLQKGPGTEQLQSWAGRIDTWSAVSQVQSLGDECPIIDLGDRLDSDGAFLDTAAIMMNLDLVVAVDSAVAHLAGALGAPVWVPLALTPDWRWLLAREDSPWYPTMRLFRQRQPGDWSEVFERIASALRGLVATRTGG